jgi:hypothetical protein
MIKPGCCPQEFIFISCGVIVVLHLGNADTVRTSISISKRKELLGMLKEQIGIRGVDFLENKRC